MLCCATPGWNWASATFSAERVRSALQRCATRVAVRVLGLSLIHILPRLVQHRFFDQPFSHWVGLVTHKPITEDWVPVLPWLGVMLWGLALGQWLLQRRPVWLAGPLPGALKPLAVLGRWSLSFYMLHQPVFIGALLAGRGLGWW